MRTIKTSLCKRRKTGFIILFIIALLGYLLNHYHPLTPPSYVRPQWRMPIVYFLIIYKILELSIFYIFLYKRPHYRLLESQFNIDTLKKFEKNAKRFFFLVPQGSIVFGILCYKLSGEIGYLLLLLTIAIGTLFLINPEKIKEI